MTDEQQRIAIAEACGWNSKSDFQINANLRYHATWVESENRGFFIPDYPNDLNAMHEAEVVIIKSGYTAIRTYEDLLQKQIANIIFATAAQRAEAFLKTLNLWIE